MVARTVLFIAGVGTCPKRIDEFIFVILWPDAARDGIADDSGIITFRLEDARATHPPDDQRFLPTQIFFIPSNAALSAKLVCRVLVV